MKNLFLITSGFVLSGCASMISNRAAFDLQCPEDQVKVKLISISGSYGAKGCGKQATYLLKEGVVILNSPIQALVAEPPTQAPTSAP